jgi:hypothetical protein
MRVQHIFLQSRSRNSGTAYNAQYRVGSGLIQCQPDERMTLSIIHFNVYRNWNQIQTDINDSFTLTRLSTNVSQTITLPAGSYPFKTLASRLSILMGAVVTWNQATNKLQFSFAESYSISFPAGQTGIAPILGFAASDTPSGTTFTSTTTLAPGSLDQLAVSLSDYGGQPLISNVDDISSPSRMKLSSLFAVIELTGAPYTYMTYQPQNPMTLTLQNDTLRYFTLSFTTFDGSPATFLNEHDLVIRVQHDKIDDPVLAEQKRTNDLLEMLVLQQQPA